MPGGHLSLGRAAPPPPAAPAAGGAGAHRRASSGWGWSASAARRSARRCRRSSTPRPRRSSPTSCSRAAEGNALYTEELLAAASEGGSDLPETLRDALLNRVERLPANALGGRPRRRRRVADAARPARRAVRADPRRHARGHPRGGRAPGAGGGGRRRSTRSGTRWWARRSTATSSPASAARCTCAWPRRWSAIPALLGDVPRRRRGRAARLSLARRARRPARARRLGRRRPGGQARVRVQRGHSATSSARWSCGTACPTRRSARAATGSTCCAMRRSPPRTRGEAARSVALDAQGGRGGRRGGRSGARRLPARAARPLPALGGRDGGGVRGLRPPRWACSRPATASSARG